SKLRTESTQRERRFGAITRRKALTPFKRPPKIKSPRPLPLRPLEEPFMKTLIVFCISIAAALAQGGAAVVGAGYHTFAPISVAPGQVITVFVTGIVNITQKYSAGNLPLPATLGGISASLNESGVISTVA